MPVVYNQAIAHRFGTALIDCLESGEWSRFSAAVAWVRRSGTRHLMPSLRAFLQDGQVVRLTVGVDIENTSKEGLEDLLKLAAVGDCKTYIHHNESGSVFHPKVYVFNNDKDARLIIGSNNLTESGLYTNTEVSLQIDAKLKDRVIADALSAITTWCDPKEGLARELDQTLLDELIAEQYVFSEDSLNKRRKESEAGRRARSGGSRRRLFSAKSVTAPKPPVDTTTSVVTPPSTSTAPTRPTTKRGRSGVRRSTGETLQVRGYPHPLRITNVLIMRVRTARGTQVQLPIPLRESKFMAGVDELISARDGSARPISATYPERGGGAAVNTYKLEIPETAGMKVPVLRLDRSSAGITYQAYDLDTPSGQAIIKSLEEGRHEVPPSTVLTKPSDPDHSTWYRFI